jgi:hypothetical protein
MSTPNGTPQSLHAGEHDSIPDLKRLPIDQTWSNFIRFLGLEGTVGCRDAKAADMKEERAEGGTRLLESSQPQKRRHFQRITPEKPA